MGAEPWIYFVPYEKDTGAALQKLRLREFTAGRYFPMTDGLDSDQAPGSIEEAIELADATGTQSILDIERVGDDADYGVVCPLDPEKLKGLFGTVQPTRSMVEGNDDFFEEIERGQGIYIVVFENGAPKEICFAGYSFD